MKPENPSFRSVLKATHSAIALLLCVALVFSANPVAFAVAQQSKSTSDNAKLPNDQLDSLVAPIALYPDPLLAQILAASTYPLEIVQLSQWMQNNSKLTGDKAAAEVKKQDWDPSVQALVVLPDVVRILNDNIKWTADLGNAFLAQQGDVMDAVQRMRAKAKSKGNLKTTEQQKVETTVIENKEVIVIQPAKTEVVYVPAYDPVVVYGPPVYPYYPYVYPPGYAWAGMAISFGVGMMIGAAWGGGWGWGCGWGGNNVYINNNNNFNRNTNINRPSQRPSGGRGNVGGVGGAGGVGGVGGAGGIGGAGGVGGVGGVGGAGGVGNRPSQQPAGGGRDNWQHNPKHRGGAPYSDRATADRFGGTARGDSMANRQANARQNQSQFGGRQQAGVSDRSSMGGGGRGGTGASAGNMSRGGAGGDRIGNQRTSNGSAGGAFGGVGNSRSTSRASSSRGASSMGSRGGGMRGGGGRRR
jgi:hypothetical protein